MLFLFSGKYRNLARSVLGIALVVIGLLIHHGIVLVVVGAILVLWGAFGTLAMLRRRGSAPTEPGQGSKNGWV